MKKIYLIRSFCMGLLINLCMMSHADSQFISLKQRQHLVETMVAVYLREGRLEGAATSDSEHLYQRLMKREEQFRLALVLNFQAIRQQLSVSPSADKQRLLQILGTYNAEAESFFRLDETGMLQMFQNRNFTGHPWACVDDMSPTHSAYRDLNYAVHLWHEHDLEEKIGREQLNHELDYLNAQRWCGSESWSLPTRTELKRLLGNPVKTEAGSAVAARTLKFPASFPGWAETSPEYLWVNADNSRKGYQPEVYHWRSDRFVERDHAVLLAKARQVVSGKHIIMPDNLSPQARQTLINELREAYRSVDSHDWPRPWVDDGVDWQPLGLLPDLPPLDDSGRDLVLLGQRLFFEPRLSADRMLSCASCHIPSQGWDDNRATAIGHAAQEGHRNTPGLLNVRLLSQLFWDGRADTLEEQALGPIANPIEMNLPLKQLKQRINAGEFSDYRQTVREVFGDDGLSPERIATALAAYQRRIQSDDSRFDRFLKAEADLSDQELWGLHLFRTKARCMNCHSGPNFTQERFENLGLADLDFATSDLGLYEVTGREEDVGKFRTPSLRELMHTAPYMHNGRFGLLETLVSYNNAMGVTNIPVKLKIGVRRHDPLFQPGSAKLHVLNLGNDEMRALEAFLKALSAAGVPQE